MARPTRRTKKAREFILERIWEGATLKEAVATLGCSRRWLAAWMAADEEFRREVLEAVVGSCDDAVEEGDEKIGKLADDEDKVEDRAARITGHSRRIEYRERRITRAENQLVRLHLEPDEPAIMQGAEEVNSFPGDPPGSRRYFIGTAHDGAGIFQVVDQAGELIRLEHKAI